MATVGRSGVCPCASGKKYKRCCLGPAGHAGEAARLALETGPPVPAPRRRLGGGRPRPPLMPPFTRGREAVRIAVVGAGAIGGYLGGWLAAAGEEVTFIARGANLEAIRASGMRVVGEDGAEVVARGARVRSAERGRCAGLRAPHREGPPGGRAGPRP
jgi:hypothetical protein